MPIPGSGRSASTSDRKRNVSAGDPTCAAGRRRARRSRPRPPGAGSWGPCSSIPASASTVFCSSESVNVCPISSNTTGRYLILPRRRADRGGQDAPVIEVHRLAKRGDRIGALGRGCSARTDIRSARARLRYSRGAPSSPKRDAGAKRAALIVARGRRPAPQQRLDFAIENLGPAGARIFPREEAIPIQPRPVRRCYFVHAGEREIADAHVARAAAHFARVAGAGRRTYTAARGTLRANPLDRSRRVSRPIRACGPAPVQTRRWASAAGRRFTKVSTWGVSARTPTTTASMPKRAGVSSAMLSSVRLGASQTHRK